MIFLIILQLNFVFSSYFSPFTEWSRILVSAEESNSESYLPSSKVGSTYFPGKDPKDVKYYFFGGYVSGVVSDMVFSSDIKNLLIYEKPENENQTGLWSMSTDCEYEACRGSPSYKEYPSMIYHKWTDSIFLFGGYTVIQSGEEYYDNCSTILGCGNYGNDNEGDANDLWMFDMKMRKWTALDFDFTQTENRPIGRKGNSYWVTEEKFIIFGGSKNQNSGYPPFYILLPNLWEFDLVTLEWNLLWGHQYKQDDDLFCYYISLKSAGSQGNNTPYCSETIEENIGYVDSMFWQTESDPDVIYFYGGSNDETSTGLLIFNDLFSYNLQNSTWTHHFGNKIGYSATEGINFDDISNYPTFGAATLIFNDVAYFYGGCSFTHDYVADSQHYVFADLRYFDQKNNEIVMIQRNGYNVDQTANVAGSITSASVLELEENVFGLVGGSLRTNYHASSLLWKISLSCYDIDFQNSGRVCYGNGKCTGIDQCTCEKVSKNNLIIWGKECGEEINQNISYFYTENNIIVLGYKVKYDESTVGCEDVIVEVEKLGTFPVCSFENGTMTIILGKDANIKIGDTLTAVSYTNTKKDESQKIVFILQYPHDNDNWWNTYKTLVISTSVGLILIVFFITFFLIIISVLVGRYRKRLKKFNSLKDIDILLEEQKLQDKSGELKMKVSTNLFEIKYEDLKVIRLIGEGATGTVLLVEYADSLACYKSFSSMVTKIEEIENELNLVASLSHMYIIKFLGVVIKPPKYGFLTEYCEHGDLVNFLKSVKKKTGYNLPNNDKIRILWEISVAMQFIHSKGIVHRDLKCENVLVDSKYTTKLMDFGLSKKIFLSKTRTAFIGTFDYMAPEVTLGNNEYSNKCDVFSYGILIYCVMHDIFRPYGVVHGVEFKVASDPFFRPKIKESLFHNNLNWLKDLMKNCWSSNSNERMSFDKISLLIKEKRKIVLTRPSRTKKPPKIKKINTSYIPNFKKENELLHKRMQNLEKIMIRGIEQKNWNLIINAQKTLSKFNQNKK